MKRFLRTEAVEENELNWQLALINDGADCFCSSIASTVDSHWIGSVIRASEFLITRSGKKMVLS